MRDFLNTRTDGDIYRVTVGDIGADPRIALRNESRLSAKELTDVIDMLARLDTASRHGKWTEKTLALIAEHPARLALELANIMSLEKVVFKRNVRKLKEMGLTESLKVGYRLSPRGKKVFQALKKA